MSKNSSHKWQFRTRFRAGVFGWKSQLPIKRIKEAVTEIKKTARQDKALGAEGAILFLEKISSAIEHVDSSSGAIGTAVNNAVESLVPIIVQAPATMRIREKWLERLWEAYQADDIPYIEMLGDYWGALCAEKEIASKWADRLLSTSRLAWSPDPELRGYFAGTTNCLSCLLAAERYDELLELLELEPHNMWCYRIFGMKALAAMEKIEEAIQYAEQGPCLNDSPMRKAEACEELLLSCGHFEDAYLRFGLMANDAQTHLGRFRLLVKKYPHKEPREILCDLVEASPGEEGKWFAAAKSMEFFDEAIKLANQSPCSPQTLTRAARDYGEKNPEFAIAAGLTALKWLAYGYGYEVSSVDVLNAYSYTLQAAEKTGRNVEIKIEVRRLVEDYPSSNGLVILAIGRQLGL